MSDLKSDNAAEIVEGWRKAMENYTLSEMSISDRHLFEQAILAEKQAKEKTFVLGGPLK